MESTGPRRAVEEVTSSSALRPRGSISLTITAASPTMSFMPTFGGFQKGGAAKFGIASQMAARTPEPMPNDFVAASGAAVFDLKYACPRRATRPSRLRARPEGPSPRPGLPPALWQRPRRRPKKSHPCVLFFAATS